MNRGILYLLFCVLTGQLYSQGRDIPLYHRLYLDVNKVQTAVTNVGSGIGNNYWEDSSSWDVLYDYGPFFVTKTDGEIVWAQNSWITLFSAGPIVDNQPMRNNVSNDDDTLRVYKINVTDSLWGSRDLTTWPEELGAPVNEEKKALCFADQSTWSIYNALAQVDNQIYLTQTKFGLEVHQNIYAYKSNRTDIPLDFLDEVIFLEYTWINKSNQIFDSAYVGFWTDLDLNNYFGENFAVDTLNQLGYHWNTPGSDPGQQDTTLSAAAGFVQLYGPLVPESNKKATFSGKPRNNSKNLKLTAFHGVGDDSFGFDHYYSIARNPPHAFYMAQGLDKQGQPVIDSLTGEITKFPWSANPVTEPAWPKHPRGGGMGFYLFSGPVTMAPGDTNWAMYAFLPVEAGGPLKSVIELKRRASELLALDYNSYVIKTPLSDPEEKTEEIIPEDYYLFQNFPNPFNNSTTVRFNLPENTHVRLNVYNQLGELVFSDNLGSMEPGIKNHTISMGNLAAGVYLYRIITPEFASVKKMVYLK